MLLKWKAKILLFLIDIFKKGFFAWILFFILSAIFVFIGSMLNPLIENKVLMIAMVFATILVTGFMVRIISGKKSSERMIQLLLRNSNFGKPVYKWEVFPGTRMYGIYYKSKGVRADMMVLEGGPSSLTWKKMEVLAKKLIKTDLLGYQLAREYFLFGDNKN